MPSRVKLKMKIVELEANNRSLEVAARFHERLAKDMQDRYTMVLVQWQKFEKEYNKLGELWNAFQGATYRPTEKDMIRRRAQGEMVQAVAQRLVELFMPKEMR